MLIFIKYVFDGINTLWKNFMHSIISHSFITRMRRRKIGIGCSDGTEKTKKENKNKNKFINHKHLVLYFINNLERFNNIISIHNIGKIHDEIMQ
jgi:hypothetical protein